MSNCCRGCVKGVLGVPGESSEHWSIICTDSNCTCHKLDRLIELTGDLSSGLIEIVQAAAEKIVKERA